MKLAALFLAWAGILSAQNLVTSFEHTTLRTDYTGYVGLQLTVGAASPAVTALARMCVAGNSRTHTVALFTVAGVMITSASVPMAGCVDKQFTYAAITPVVLAAGSSYFLASLESAGGDQWWDQGIITLIGTFAPATSIYQYNGVWYPSAIHASYGPVDFRYQAAAPPVTPPPSAGYVYIGAGSSIVTVQCPAGWIGAKLPDGKCLAVIIP